MSNDSSAKNTPNAPEFVCPICLPKPNVLDFDEKRLHWESVVRDVHGSKNIYLLYVMQRTYTHILVTKSNSGAAGGGGAALVATHAADLDH